ncbi:MAG: 4-(cytidine 5'-diphospho)-2-C-methyl-D-erythritol kinase [Coxiellaceae bacterium]|nr:4-(cytidine 5'-diphospho)-2-C-methyl-D-erythritol kinase [Coxiellaceae bacterium]
MQNLSLPSPAKLNLFLHILGRRNDGYHNIQTLFQFIDWCDTLHFHLRNDDRIVLSSNMVDLPDDQNLIVKAANCLREETGCTYGINIDLQKNLPMGAGIGGGSSNAATTLLALNYLWQTQLNTETLMAIGRRIGADVPIFVYGHASWAEGIGDELTPMILPESWYVLLVPKTSVRTESIYQDPRLTRDSAALTMDHYRPGQGHNDFERLLRFDYPEIAHALDWLGQFSKSRMTGSGSVVFAAFDSKEEAGTIAAQAPPSYQVQVVKGLNESPLHKILK